MEKTLTATAFMTMPTLVAKAQMLQFSLEMCENNGVYSVYINGMRYNRDFEQYENAAAFMDGFVTAMTRATAELSANTLHAANFGAVTTSK